jgi:DNA-binding beta-propeller fold protein YncE
VRGAQPSLLDTVPTGGSMPTSVTQVGDLVYVLNAGGNASVTGFRIVGNGHLQAIPHSTSYLSGSATAPTDVVLSPSRRFLIVTESAANNIIATDSAGTVPFAAVFAPNEP